MGMHFWRDTSEQTDAIFKKLIRRHFPLLKKAKFLFTLRDKEKFDDEGNLIAGETRKAGSKERDLWDFDFEICLDSEIWSKYNKVDKYRLAYHELCHCGVEVEEGTSEPKYDDNNRLKTHLIKHDVWLKTFKNEIEIFGFDSTDHEVATYLGEMMDNKDKIKKAKTKFLADLGIEIYKEGVSESKAAPEKKNKKQTAEELEAAADELLGLKKKLKRDKIKKEKKKRKDYGD